MPATHNTTLTTGSKSDTRNKATIDPSTTCEVVNRSVEQAVVTQRTAAAAVFSLSKRCYRRGCGPIPWDSNTPLVRAPHLYVQDTCTSLQPQNSSQFKC